VVGERVMEERIVGEDGVKIIQCGQTIIKYVHLFNLMVKKKLSHHGKQHSIPRLNLTKTLSS
jgi:hypothetical protein